MEEFDYWQCPGCGWDPPEGFYFVEEGKVIDCTEVSVDDRGVGVFPDPPKDKESFPQIKNRQYSRSLDFMNAVDWDEIHFCPYCNEEFWFQSGNY